MFYRTTALATVAALTASMAHADAHAGLSGYALANGGSTLVVMADLSNPSAVSTYDLEMPIAGLATRPVTGELYGISDGMVVTINPMSGEITDTGATFADDAMLGADAMVAFDFNNAIDAVRAVSSEGTNLVYFPEGFGDNDERANSVLRFTDAFYVDGDANVGTTPMIFANAYTNAIVGSTAESTFQYALDAETDSLVALANNAGELTTIAAVTVEGEPIDLSGMGGFDIFSPEEGTDQAYAILQAEGVDDAGLFSIDLETGAATPITGLGMGGFTGFAVGAAM
ncbi:DUF4394 domain-containing protein [Rhodobacterales bacterium HKCCE4037]|nr:DUF4394 domain-containing protein [Rhodobacterales bacterium HKCCE4037]